MKDKDLQDMVGKAAGEISVMFVCIHSSVLSILKISLAIPFCQSYTCKIILEIPMAGFRIAVFGLVLASSCAVAQSAGRAELEEVLVTAQRKYRAFKTYPFPSASSVRMTGSEMPYLTSGTLQSSLPVAINSRLTTSHIFFSRGFFSRSMLY